MTRLISTIIVTSLTSNAFAGPLGDFNLSGSNCPPAAMLHVGDVVKDCDRVGLNLQTDILVRKDLLREDELQQITKEQQDIIAKDSDTISLLQKEISVWKVQVSTDQTTIADESSAKSTSFWLGFGLGILATSAAIYAGRQMGK